MIVQWFKTLVSGGTPEAVPAPPPLPEAAPPPVPEPVAPSPAEVAYVEKCLSDFERIGLRRMDDALGARDWAAQTLAQIGAEPGKVADDANRIVDRCPFPPLTVLWHWDDRFEDPRPLFANALIVFDHCYDGATEDSLREVIRSVAALAAGDRPLDDVSVSGPLRYGQPYRVELRSGASPGRVELIHDKDFDWSLIERLNDELPASSPRRFGWMGDGGTALFVYLEPARIRELSALCGTDFLIPGSQAS